MRKLQSLGKLKALNFNTPIYRTISNDGELFESVPLFESWGKIGIRSDDWERDIDNLPCFFDRTPQQAVGDIQSILSRGLVAIPAKSIDPQDSLLAGKYLKYETWGLIECFEGAGTIRQAIENGLTHTLYGIRCDSRRAVSYPSRLSPFIPTLNSELIHDTWCFVPPVCIEWAIYPYPIGELNNNFVFWEVHRI